MATTSAMDTSSSAPDRSAPEVVFSGGKVNGRGEPFTTSNEVTICPAFEEMGLDDDLLRGIYHYGMCESRYLQMFGSLTILQVLKSLLPSSSAPSNRSSREGTSLRKHSPALEKPPPSQ